MMDLWLFSETKLRTKFDTIISKGVYSSNQPHYTSGKYGGWSMTPIVANQVQLLFLVKSEKGEEYITATVKSVIASE